MVWFNTKSKVYTIKLNHYGLVQYITLILTEYQAGNMIGSIYNGMKVEGISEY